MQRNKKRASAYKAKETYLLSGLIYCGECGHAMIGNVKHSGRNKLKYVTYRCGNRDRTKGCKNKEIYREYIEEYVLQQLEEKIFNEANIPLLVEKLNKNNKNDEAKQKIKALTEKIRQVDIQIKNVLSMIRSGCSSRILAEDLENLEKEKMELELQLHEIKDNSPKNIIDEKTLAKIFSSFRQFVKDRNIQEVKRFIHQYVEKVLVYEDHVKVVFKLYIIVATFGGGEGSRTPVRRCIDKSFYRFSSRFGSRRLFSREQDKRPASSVSFSRSAGATPQEDPAIMTPFSRPAGAFGKGAPLLIKRREPILRWRLFYASGFTSRKARPAAFIPATPVETTRPHIQFMGSTLLYNKRIPISRNIRFHIRPRFSICFSIISNISLRLFLSSAANN